MKLISHRGNIDGLNPSMENSPEYITEAIDAGYDVEIDVWSIDHELYLGHDNPQYPVKLDWLSERRDSLWIHAKNFEALDSLIDKKVRVFYHTSEEQTIINNCNLIWSHNLNTLSGKSIIPLLSIQDSMKCVQYNDVYGICSDFIESVKLYLYEGKK